MRVEYINPFVEAAFEIMQQLLGSEVMREQLYLKRLGEEMKGVAVIIGVTGSVSGRVLLDMTPETAIAISGVMNGETFTEINSMVRSTINEVGNMIVGNATTKLADINMAFNFTPPTVIIGKGITIFENDMEAAIIPVDTGHGVIEINVAFRD